MSQEKLELPFKQLLWIMFKLRETQKKHREFNDSRTNVKYWEQKADEILKTIGVTTDTDFKNIKIVFNVD